MRFCVEMCNNMMLGCQINKIFKFELNLNSSIKAQDLNSPSVEMKAIKISQRNRKKSSLKTKDAKKLY